MHRLGDAPARLVLARVLATVAICHYLLLGVSAYQCVMDITEVKPSLPVFKVNATSPDPQASLCKDLTPHKMCYPLPWDTEACQGGFYLSGTRILPCYPGYFCPANMLCLVPCPEGAYCVESKFNLTTMSCRPKYTNLKRPSPSDDPDAVIIGPSLPTCGGPSSLDTAACKKGYYCPTTNQSNVCPAGSYCREGRVTPQRCPFLTKCQAKTGAPIANLIGLVVDLVLIGLLILLWMIIRYKYELREFCRKHLCRCCKRRTGYSRVCDAEGNRANGVSEMKPVCQPTDELGYVTPLQSTVQPKTFTVDIRFRNLSLTLKSSKKKVLQGATGKLQPCTLTAIMGGSGAGKTTLLNALSGKAYYGIVDGVVEINGEPANIATYRSIMGFVPQEDIMHRDLTTREVLYYQGMLRLSGCASFGEINRKVDEVLALLGLSHIADSKIGDEEKRGISGGQRKRVNIGMELVADPTLLFLDEPTSGLDSVSSMQVSCRASQRWRAQILAPFFAGVLCLHDDMPYRRAEICTARL